MTQLSFVSRCKDNLGRLFLKSVSGICRIVKKPAKAETAAK